MIRARRRAARRFAVVAALFLVACREGGAARATPESTPLGAPASVELETRHYRFGVDDDEPLVSGWSGQREFDARSRRHFVWATEEEATFALTVLRVEDKQGILALRSVPTKTPQRIEIIVNDRSIGEIHPLHHFREFRLEIPAEALHLGRNRLTLRHAVLRPSHDRRDPRSFAAAYSTLLLGPACLPLRPKGPPAPPEIGRTDSSDLEVTGPAALHWTIDARAAGSVRAALELAGASEGTAEAVLSLRRDDSWVDVGRATLSLPWWGSARPKVLEGDVDGSVEVRLLVRPLSCDAMRATVRLKDVALASPTNALHAESGG